MHTVTVCFQKEVGDQELDLLIDCYVSPGERECWTLSNGDPGYPGSGPDVDLDERTLRVDDKAQTPIKCELTTDEIELICDLAIEQAVVCDV